MNVLILGSGGREHAISWKISQSPLLNKLFVAPGNAGTGEAFTNVNMNISDAEEIADFCKKQNINMIVIGPEQPLVEGLVDKLKNNTELTGIKIIGPDSKGAQLEGSKNFAKEFMKKYNIPTARHRTFTINNLPEGEAFIDELAPPYVLKADGLAAGKGVLIINDKQEAKDSLKEMLGGKFGQAGQTVVIEEFLDGIEYSVFVLTDGLSYKILPEAKDYKRIGEKDTGLNTGGMGAISPVPFFDDKLREKTEKQIIIPTINGIIKEDFDYRGFIFFGLIKVNDNPYVIEYNVRLGDPEAEVVVPRIDCDFLELLIASADKKLKDTKININQRAFAAVMAVSGGYPEDYKKGIKINGLNDIENSIIFHAGTKKDNDEMLTAGGRVIAVCSEGENIKKALELSYRNLEKIEFEDMYYRNDIGFDLL